MVQQDNLFRACKLHVQDYIWGIWHLDFCNLVYSFCTDIKNQCNSYFHKLPCKYLSSNLLHPNHIQVYCFMHRIAYFLSMIKCTWLRQGYYFDRHSTPEWPFHHYHHYQLNYINCEKIIYQWLNLEKLDKEMLYDQVSRHSDMHKID